MSLQFNFIPISDNQAIYKILELKPQEEDQQIIKKNYNKLLKLNHPDKGGSEEKMQNIVKAMEILMNPGLKYLYDRFGKIVFEVVHLDQNYLFLLYFKWAFDSINIIKDLIKNFQILIEEERKKIKALECQLKIMLETEEQSYKTKTELEQKELIKLESQKMTYIEKEIIEKQIKEAKENLSQLQKNEASQQEKESKMKANVWQIKLHMEEKVRIKFKDIYLDSMDNLKSLEIIGEIQTNQFDYFNAILKNPLVLSFKNFRDLRKENLFDEENMNITSNIEFYKINTLSVSLESELKLDKKNKFLSQNYELNINKLIQFPSPMKVFENDFIVTRNVVGYDIHGSQINFTHGFNLPNFLYKENLLFKLDLYHTFNFEHKKFFINHLKLGFNYKFHNKLTSVFNFDIKSNNLEAHLSKKLDKSNKLTFYANIGKSKTLFGLQKNFYSTKPTPDHKLQNSENQSITDYTGSYSNQNSIYLHEKGIMFNNQNNINFKLFGFDFDTSSSIIKKGQLKFNTTFTFGFRIHKLNFKIPIKISKTKNFFIFSLVFLSNWFGPLMYNLYLRYKKYKRNSNKYFIAVSEVIKEKYDYFLNNNNNIDKYNRIVAREKGIDGLIINYAFIGNIEDIEILNYEVKLLGISNPQIFKLGIFKEKKIYDIKMALSMRIVESKINIKNDLFDAEGIYNPALSKYENIGIIICYTYKFDTFYEYVKNVEKIKIPLVD